LDSGIIDNGRDSPEPVRRERHLVVDAFPCKGVADDACAVSNRHHLEGRHLNVDVHLGAALGIGNGGEGDPKVLFLDTGHVGNYFLQLLPKVFVEVADGVVQLHCDLNKGGVVRGVPKLTPKVTVAVADIRRERCDTRALSRDVALSRCSPCTSYRRRCTPADTRQVNACAAAPVCSGVLVQSSGHHGPVIRPRRSYLAERYIVIEADVSRDEPFADVLIVSIIIVIISVP
jgi:hypothetical protein